MKESGKKATSNQKNKKLKEKYEKQRKERIKRERNEDKDRVKLFVSGKSLDLGILADILMLLTIGLIMILSASAPYSLGTEGDSYFYFKKQLYFAIAGIILMFVVSKIDYRIFNSRISYLAYIRWSSE